MSYYDTIEEDLARAKEILAEGSAAQELEGVTAPAIISLGGGTIYGKDIYAAYKLLESFVQYIETHFRPDHNGECLNCDEPEDGHRFPKAATVTCPLCDWSARNEVDEGDPEARARIEHHLGLAFAAHVQRAHGDQSFDK